jgi:hypothetical protein
VIAWKARAPAAEAERDASKARIAELEVRLSDAETAIERIAHPTYGLGFQKLRGIARAYQQKHCARTTLAAQPQDQKGEA